MNESLRGRDYIETAGFSNVEIDLFLQTAVEYNCRAELFLPLLEIGRHVRTLFLAVLSQR